MTGRKKRNTVIHYLFRNSACRLSAAITTALWQLPAFFSCTSLQSDSPVERERQIYIQWNKKPTTNPVDLFFFETSGAQNLDAYQQIPAWSQTPVYGLSARGPRRLVAFSGMQEGPEAWYGIRTYGDLCKQRFSLEEDRPESPLLVGEAILEDEASRQIQLEMKSLLTHIRLQSVSAQFEGLPYAGAPFENTLLYIGYAGIECLPLGWSERPALLGWLNSGAPDSLAVLRLPRPDMLLQEGCGTIGATRIYPQRDFYCYPGPQTRLVLSGSINGDTCHYPIPLPQLQAGGSYRLNLTLRRKGSPSPDLPVQSESVLVESETVPWIWEEPQHISF